MNLDTLHLEISSCTICRDQFARDIDKPKSMNRGSGVAQIMGIGIAPGQSAIAKGESFAGNSFSKILRWFGEAGFQMTDQDMRSTLYLTSLNKCAAKPDNLLNRKMLFRHCQKFLWKQIEVVCPDLILMLGSEVTNSLVYGKSQKSHSGEIVGTSWSSNELFSGQLLPPVNIDCRWLAMPHPSGLSRTMNDRTVHDKVISKLREELQAINFTLAS